MRAAALASILEELDPDTAAKLLEALAASGRGGSPLFDCALMAAVDLVAEERLSYARRRAIFEHAAARGLWACTELFYSHESEAAIEALAAAPRALQPGTRPLTLGERKALARSWTREVLERLLVDPHVDVVSELLRNPRITEDDVLSIATARRSTAAVLNLILQSRRWGVRSTLRRALVHNPRLPEAVALRLIGLLNRNDLRSLAQAPHLSPRLRRALRRRLDPSP